MGSNPVVGTTNHKPTANSAEKNGFNRAQVLNKASLKKGTKVYNVQTP